MTSLVFEDQRVGVFVDVQNMYYSAKNRYNSKVDFEALLSEAGKGRKLVRAFAYAIESDTPGDESFFELLEEFGYEVKKKELKVYYGGAKKGDWDMGIAIDAMKMASKLDVVCLVTGDGDFTALVEHLKANGVKVEIIAFSESASQKLIKSANGFVDMSDDQRKFLM